VVAGAILRAREIRKKLRVKLLNCDLSKVEVGVENFAKSKEELTQKIYCQMASFLLAEQKWEGLNGLSSQQRLRVLDLWERRLSRREDPYLSGRHSSDWSMHVLKAFAKSLDSHSSFFSQEEAYDLKTALEKQFEGVGIVLREGISGVVIKDLVPNSPAELSGRIQKGDILLSVNGKSTGTRSYEEVLALLRGDRGEKVTLGFRRGNDTWKVKLVREKVVMQEDRVKYSWVPFGSGILGKIEIPSFYESSDGSSCASDLKHALHELKSQGALVGVVLDLRENSGGFLNQAVKVASLFMSGGVVVVSKYAEGQMQYLRNTDGKIFYQGPLLILTSKASASAAEIVAQALQDYGIAVVVGDERTYGKGTIQYQTVTDKKNPSLFKVTVGKYYTVSGRSTQIEGVRADIVVPTNYAPFPIGEKYLLYPLKNDQIESIFTDPLKDISPKSKSWMRKNYLPNLQKKLSFWTESLPVLRKNSEYRLLNNPNFVRFLKQIHSEASEEDPSILDEDLQMEEAVQILQDMAFLGKNKKNQKKL
jgi:carboxyl-terminal processing protease